MIFLIIVMLNSPPSTAPVNVDATRLELGAKGSMVAREWALEKGALKLRGSSARLAEDAQCGGPLLSANQGFSFTLSPFTGSGLKMNLCAPGKAMHMTGLTMNGPQLRLSSDKASLHIENKGASTHVVLRDFSITTCGCHSPPWVITGKDAEFDLSEGGWIKWPVLRLGGVPIATVPRWYVPLGQRRSGFLFPRLGWQGENGFDGRLPYFLTLGTSADLTLSPGWRATVGSSNGVRLRWATAKAPKNTLILDTVAHGWWLRGRGTYEKQGLTFSMETDASSGPSDREQLTRGIELRRTRHALSTLSAAYVRKAAGAGARVTGGQELGEGGSNALKEQFLRPEAWFNWQPFLNPFQFSMIGQAQSVFDPDYDDVDRFSLSLGTRGATWFGPFRLRPDIKSTTIFSLFEHDGSQTHIQQLSRARADIRIAAQRRYPSLVHQLALHLDGRWHEVNGEPVTGLSPYPTSQVPPTRSLGLIVSSRWSTPQASALLRIMERYEYWQPRKGFDPLDVNFRLRHPSAGVYVRSVGTDFIHGHARIGARKKKQLRMGITHIGPRLQYNPIYLRNGGGQRLFVDADALNGLTGLVGTTLPFKQLSLSWDGFLDLKHPLLLGQRGRVRWVGRCRCWGLKVQISHELERKQPDVMLMVSLGPQRQEDESIQ